MDGWQTGLDEQLAGWRLRLRTVASEIAHLQAERENLEQKLKAAEVLLGRPHMPELHEEDRPLSVREAVESLMKDGKARNGNEIRRALIAAGFDATKVGTTSGAFYNALSRLVDRNVLEKSEKGTYRVKAPIDPEIMSMLE